jgi:cysteine-rich repeat protein
VAGNDCQVTGEVNDLTSSIFSTFTRIVPNMPRFDGCGNGLVTSGESCDDGNTTHFDGCPSNCVIAACTPTSNPRPVRVVINDSTVASVIIELDYPEGKVSLPGTGDTADVDNLSGAFQFDYLDFDHAIRIGASDAAAFGTTDVARLNFVDCSVGGPPVVADFTCTVTSASDAGGATDKTATTTCTVMIP